MYFLTIAITVKTTDRKIDVCNTVKSRYRDMYNRVTFKGKLIILPTIVSLIDSIQAFLLRRFIHLVYQIDRSVLELRVCLIANQLIRKTFL